MVKIGNLGGRGTRNSLAEHCKNQKKELKYSLEELPEERDSESPMRNTENEKGRRSNHFRPLNKTEN